jgi:hypothetical protein
MTRSCQPVHDSVPTLVNVSEISRFSPLKNPLAVEFTRSFNHGPARLLSATSSTIDTFGAPPPPPPPPAPTPSTGYVDARPDGLDSSKLAAITAARAAAFARSSIVAATTTTTITLTPPSPRARPLLPRIALVAISARTFDPNKNEARMTKALRPASASPRPEPARVFDDRPGVAEAELTLANGFADARPDAGN